MAVRHADACSGDITENQHEENRMRDIRVGKRGSEAASEEQPDKLRKTVRFEQEAPSASASSDSLVVALEYPASGVTQGRLGSVLVQKSGHVDDDVQTSALDAFYEMDGRKSRYIGEELDWYRGEDAEDLKRSALNELVENLTCLNALEGTIWKSNEKVVMDEEINPKILMDDKSWKTSKSNQKIVMNEELVQNGVMNEELVQNGVMNEKFVKNFVMNAKIDPKVVMDLSIFKIGGWNSLQPINQTLLEEFIDANELWLLIGIPSGDPLLVTQYLERHSVRWDQHMKKLMSLREGLHVMMQCCMRQHTAGRWLHEHPGGYASWMEPTMKKFRKESTTYFVKGPVCRWNVQKMRSESSEYVRKTTGFFKKLENQNSLGELL